MKMESRVKKGLQAEGSSEYNDNTAEKRALGCRSPALEQNWNPTKRGGEGHLHSTYLHWFVVVHIHSSRFQDRRKNLYESLFP